jgi:hypothetical protein
MEKFATYIVRYSVFRKIVIPLLKQILFNFLFLLWVTNADINFQDKEALNAFRDSTNIASEIADWAV